MNILLAEDEPDIQLVTRLALEDEGHQVVVVSDGQAVLEQVQTQHFDVVLLDIMMPYLDGFAVCRCLKQDPHTTTLPIIFLTAKAQEEEIQQGLKLGAIGYITKPFDVFTLTETITVLLMQAL